MLSTTISFQLINRDIPRALQLTSQQPQVEREISHFLEKISDIKSLDEFMADDRVFRFAMRAFGLGELDYAKAFMRKILEEGTADPRSLANSLGDSRYRDFVDTFDFERYGSSTTAFSRATTGTVERYVQQTMEEEAGSDNQGVRLALYFQRNAGNLNSALDVLADPALLAVTRTALGLPAEISSLNIDKQAALISARLDIDALKTPEGLDRFLNRFTALWDLSNPQSAPQTPNLLVSRPATFGIGPDLLLGLQSAGARRF